MQTGIDARLDRIGTDGTILNVPMDHGITIGATDGLREIESTIGKVTAAGADSVLTQKGLAERVHPNKHDAGYVIHLNASTTLGPDANDKRLTGTVKEAVQRGADAVSFHMNVGSDHEPEQMEDLAGVVRSANELGVPVLAMTYARGPGVDESDPEALAHAARVGEELGADVVKTGYSGDPDSFERVVEATACPVIAAGGSPRTDREMLSQVRGVMDAGASGVSMGRSVFQHETPGGMTAAVSAVVHDDAAVEDALAELASAGD
jgi:fructose-bisphosphate aldolase/2-amino-3,7-dideoxy-D-threo-hept-6-ulosonate synthase